MKLIIKLLTPIVNLGHFLLDETERCLSIISWISILAASGIILYVRFSNPELTETQLLIEHRQEWVAALLLLAIAICSERIKARQDK